ncbi:MAG: uracil-DNA glycosylase family protein [Hyphomicrobiaceae bacterium]
MDALLAEIRRCQACVTDPIGEPLAHKPRPVLCAQATASIGIFGQAPGVRVHASGKPFTDPSGVRLREWMDVDEDTFYDDRSIAIVPMGFCFPGLDAKGGDRPPRRECAPIWRERVLAALPNLDLVLLIGSYAQKWHLKNRAGRNVTETVKQWRDYLETPTSGGPVYVPTPHPSWRNNAWLKANPWFERELLPMLREKVASSLAKCRQDNASGTVDRRERF